MCESDHNYDDREVTNSLIDLSEVSIYFNDNKTKGSRSAVEWTNAITGWKKPNDNALKTNNGNTIKKKRIVERSLTDLTYGNGYSNQNFGDDYWSNGSALGEQKQAVRCIGDEMETFPVPPWKSNIEQGTCRYIHDNGSYRTLKFMYDDRKEWYTMRKKRPEKVSTTWHHTCKRMQREMKRQLKKELATAERERDRNLNLKSRQSSAKSSTGYTSAEETHISTGRSLLSVEENLTEAKKGNQYFEQSVEKEPQQSIHNELFIGREQSVKHKEVASNDTRLSGIEYVKHVRRKETRVRSTHSDGAVNQKGKMKTIHESEPVTPVPHYSIPSGSQMIKSASDLFIENFSTRISALEDEIKKDSKWLRKNENDLTKMQSNRPKYREAGRSNFKDSLTPRGPIRTEHLTSDIFSVKPMAQKELRPLDKIKNGNKTNNMGDFIQNERYGNSPNKNNHINHNGFTNANNNNMELDRGPIYKGADDICKQGLFDTLTGTKINTQNNKKTSKGFSTPSTITLCDNGSNNGNTSQHVNEKAGDLYRPIPIVIEKKHEKRGTLQNVPALLPEISGKRLEPTSVGHRLM
ncbi:uncharacterized protein LOC132746570 [Ruditapes philippinarum]|uniref:uncharacterized protein LOC132746570 n=1 Tax=Ruditapes philippinarum TaxID=129788 RepID=UPI00295B173E|nr:uncharacterized protein LOC132746570 [Ruditapes philippinarum]